MFVAINEGIAKGGALDRSSHFQNAELPRD
jgi:hypothetical protein